MKPGAITHRTAVWLHPRNACCRDAAFALCDAFDGRHTAALRFSREHETRGNESIVHDHRACAAVAGAASFLGAGQAESASHRTEQGFIGRAQEPAGSPLTVVSICSLDTVIVPLHERRRRQPRDGSARRTTVLPIVDRTALVSDGLRGGVCRRRSALESRGVQCGTDECSASRVDQARAVGATAPPRRARRCRHLPGPASA